MYVTERMIDAHEPTDSCRSPLPGREIIRQNVVRFAKIQYDLLQEKLRQTPIIPEDSGEETVVTPACTGSK